ncbi:uncharacterized protein LOC128296946 [Anopheles moucheti]|uniref:uncharacterized protein LOC128296946 n=1 Tax=Anopheles moucheti TaxID=186751 RepID=UPI0022F142B9|nr:uncharacterized protein LOC128296946 [Anopheles moucheti]
MFRNKMLRKASSDSSHEQPSLPSISANNNQTTAQRKFDLEKRTDNAESSLSDLVSTGKGRSTIHGEMYQVRLGLVITLRGFRMYQEDRGFDFAVGMEDPIGKDFDDIMYHYRSSPISTGTVCVQAKHKQDKKSKLTKSMLLAPSNSSNSAFSIPKYFLSFLEVDQQLKTDTHTYVLCTNALLDESLEKWLMVKKIHVDDGLQFCYDIGATCYQINRNAAHEKLKAAIKKTVPKNDSKLPCSAIFQEENLVRELEKFYESFVLVCNSLNEEELYGKAVELLPKWCSSTIIRDRLHTLMIDAMKSLESMPIDIPLLKKTFIDEIDNTKCGRLSSSSKEYIESLRLKYPHIEINAERLIRSKLATFLGDADADEVYELNSHLDSTISSIIIAQTLLLFECEALFVDGSKLEENQELIDILQDWCSYLRDVNHPTIKVITVVGKPKLPSIDTIEKLSKKFKQKIVVVEKMSENQQKDNHCETFSVHDLTHEASRQVFEGNNHKIIFGTDTPLRQIVDESDDLCFLLTVLERYNQSSDKKENLNEYNYDQINHWYIHRDYCEDNDRKKQLENVPLLMNNHRIDLPYTKDKDVPFEKMAELIDYNNTTFSEVQRVLAMSEEDPIPPGFEKDDNGNVFIFLNDSGHGKTCYFTWLAWRLAKLDRALYVVKLNAIEYTSDFERLDNIGVQTIDDTGIVRLLYRLVHLALFVPSVNKQTEEETNIQRKEADQCAELLTCINGRIVLDEIKTKELPMRQLIELRLFRAKFNEQQFVLIFDGYDEIAPNYDDVVLCCIERFAQLERIRNIYLSSRPLDLEKKIRKTFNNCNINRLKPFSRDNVILSLHKFLLNNVANYKDCEREQCMYVLTVLYIVITEMLNELSTVPLLLCLAQDILLPTMREHINFKLYTISKNLFANAKLDTMQLVEHFIDRKFHILHTVKSGTTDSAIKTPAARQSEERSIKLLKERHVLLAMFVIFDHADREKLLSTKDQELATEFIENVIGGDEKTGIIEGIRDGIPHFVHRIFAEYFAACWLSRNRKRFRNESVFQSQVIWTDSLEKMRDFFNRMILRESEGCDLHWAVLNQSPQQFSKILRKNPNAVHEKDKVGRSPLHLPHSYWMYQMSLPNEEEMLSNPGHATDELFQWNALDYAFILNDGLAIGYLLKLGVRFNEKILFEQLYSNDVDNLLFQGTNYAFFLEHYGKQPDAANAMRTRFVRHLIIERKLDIYSPRKKFESLSLLEFSAAWNLPEIFHQLISQSGQPPVQVLDGWVDRLYQLAFERKAHDIITYLADRCSFPLPWINNISSVVLVAKRIARFKSNQQQLFKTIFQQLCIRYKFINVEESEIIDEIDAQNENNSIEIEYSFENDCCVLSSNNVNLSVPEYSLLDDFDFNVAEIVIEFLLTRAIHVGSVQIASYILQKTKMPVTNRLIVTIMRLLPKSQPLCHKKSMSAFRYLLDKTVDLYSVDHEGRNLLQMVAQNGCFYMLPCLIAKGFDPKQINVLNHWNGYHYLATCADKFVSRVPKVFAYFQHLEHVDGFETLSIKGESVFDIAIANENYLASQMLFQTRYCNLSYMGKVGAVMDIIQRLLLSYDSNIVLCVLYSWYNYSIYTQDEMWHAVYFNIDKSIPII